MHTIWYDFWYETAQMGNYTMCVCVCVWIDSACKVFGDSSKAGLFPKQYLKIAWIQPKATYLNDHISMAKPLTGDLPSSTVVQTHCYQFVKRRNTSKTRL